MTSQTQSVNLKPAIIYLRCSTAAQTESVSLDAQEARCREWCQAHGYKVVGKYVDGGISGKRMDNRPQFIACIERVCKERLICVTYSISRASRSVHDFFGVLDRIGKAGSGAGFVAVSENFSTDGQAGSQTTLMAGLFSTVSMWEARIISERTKNALSVLRQSGKRVSGIAPFGFSINGEMLKLNAKEKTVVKVMRGLRVKGLSFWAIANELERRRIFNRAGNKFQAGSIRRILSRADTMAQAAA